MPAPAVKKKGKRGGFLAANMEKVYQGLLDCPQESKKGARVSFLLNRTKNGKKEKERGERF